MLKQLPFKKEYVLVIAMVLVLLISYQLAFKKTVKAWQLKVSLKNQLAQSTDVSDQPQYQQRKNDNLERIIGLYKADTVDFRGNIISTISIVAGKENVKLSEVPIQNPLYHTSQFIVQKLDFEGDYFSLTKVLNRLQSTNGIGLIRSVSFKIGNRLNNYNAKKLVLEVYLEIVGK